ncbi:trans-Golgi network integral membrane protein 2 [Acomys russatus]|uniref:trans-Golgi network integral membrane protein 2 n=1 Tax=Acomys russatus TaxID=60746 RepID=UPI0021E261B9|nr:trans-Golgi network integral membrane protein 2 [Acomys russatus]
MAKWEQECEAAVQVSAGGKQECEAAVQVSVGGKWECEAAVQVSAGGKRECEAAVQVSAGGKQECEAAVQVSAAVEGGSADYRMRFLVALLLLSVAAAGDPPSASKPDTNPSRDNFSIESISEKDPTTPPPVDVNSSNLGEPSGPADQRQQPATEGPEKPRGPTKAAVTGSAESGQQTTAANLVEPQNDPKTVDTESTDPTQQPLPPDPKQEKSRQKPTKGESEKPTKGDSEKPTKDDSDKPTKDDSEKPTKDDSDKPTKGDSDKPTKGDSEKSTSKSSSDKETPKIDKIQPSEKGSKPALTSKTESGESLAGGSDFSLKPEGGDKPSEPTEDVEVKEVEEDDAEPEESSPLEEGNGKVVGPSSGENREGTLVEAMSDGEENASKDGSGNTSAESSHFFAYLVTAAVLVAVLYVAYHNKRKIIAFALEGKRSKVTRRPKASDYQRLNLKVRSEKPSLGRICNLRWATFWGAAAIVPSLRRLKQDCPYTVHMSTELKIQETFQYFHIR